MLRRRGRSGPGVDDGLVFGEVALEGVELRSEGLNGVGVKGPPAIEDADESEADDHKDGNPGAVTIVNEGKGEDDGDKEEGDAAAEAAPDFGRVVGIDGGDAAFEHRDFVENAGDGKLRGDLVRSGGCGAHK